MEGSGASWTHDCPHWEVIAPQINVFNRSYVLPWYGAKAFLR